MGRGHIPLTLEPRSLGPGGGSLRRGSCSGSLFRGAPVRDPRIHRAAELPEKRRQVVDPRRSDPGLGRGRPAARLTSAHSPLPAVSFLFSQATASSAALLTGCRALLPVASAGFPTRADAVARPTGKTGHRPAHIPLGLSSTNKRAKPEAGTHGKGHGFEPKSRAPFLCLSHLPVTASNLSGKASSVKKSTLFQSHLLAPVVHQALNAGVQRRLLSPAAAAAKSFQSCPTLCDPIDGSPPGSPVPGILQARTLEWVAISFSKKLII